MMGDTYGSPRISSEVTDCALPLTFDQYSRCSFGCLYCFAAMQKSQNLACAEDFRAGKVKPVDVEKVKRLFLGKATGTAERAVYETLIKNRIPLHWGGLADPADAYEKKYGVGLQLLRFFKEIDYPVFLCFKGGTFFEKLEYAKVFRGAQNFAFQLSIISLDAEKCKKIELGAPSPQKRLEYMRIGHEEWGLPVYLRLRPFVMGLSEDTAVELVEKSAQAGALAVSVEFMCINTAADEFLQDRYRKMGEVLGHNVVEYYRANSRVGESYKRLSPEIRMPHILKLRDAAQRVGMRFAVSGPIGKHLNDTGCCCGLPDDGSIWGAWADTQFTSALLKCKACGSCSFPEMLDGRFPADYLKQIYRKAYLNAGCAKLYQVWKDASLEDYLREQWNHPKLSASPYYYFWGKMNPVRLDENEDIVYEYNPEAYKGAEK